MKRIVLALVMLMFLCSSVYAAGTVAITGDTIYIKNAIARKVLTLTWVGDGAGGTAGQVPTTTITANTYNIVGWYLYSVETNPGTTAPTDNYDIVINDADGLDITGALIMNRDTANTELVLIGFAAHGYPIVRSDLSFVLTGQSVASATGTAILTFVPE